MIRRDCQKEALACIQTTTDVTNLQLCTGAGKSYIMYDASILPTVQTCMIIVPSLLLIQQYYKDMTYIIESVVDRYGVIILSTLLRFSIN